MKILLFQSPLGRKQKSVFPHGLVCIATYIQQRHEVKVYNPNGINQYRQEIRQLITEFKPDLIGVSLRNIDTTRISDPWFYFVAFEKFLEEIDQINSDIPIVVGGTGFSIFPEELMKRSPHIDLGVYCEGEESFMELLDNLDSPEKVKGVYYRESNEIRFTGNRPPPNIAELPRIDRKLVELARYSLDPFDIGVETKRGCLLQCAYCCYPYLNGKKVRVRTPKEVVDEIEEMALVHGLTTFSFIDSVLDVPRDNCEAICRELIERNLPITWSGWYSGRNFDEEFFHLTSKAGCVNYSFSPDGFTKNALEGLNKYVRHEDILNILEIFRRNDNGSKVSFNFFINSPQIRLGDFLRTIAFCIKAKLVLKGRISGLGTDYIRILPHTGIYEFAKQNSLLSPGTSMLVDNPEDFSKLFFHAPKSRHIDLVYGLFNSFKATLKKILGVKKIVD